MTKGTAYRHYLDKLSVNFYNGGTGSALSIPEKEDKYERLLFLSSGRLILRTQTECADISAPYFILSPAGTKISLSAFSNESTELFWADFNLECGGAGLFELSCYPVCAPVTDNEETLQLFKTLLNPDSHPLTGPLKQKSALLKIITSYINNSAGSIKYENYDTRTTAVLDYIQQNLDREINIEELSSLVHMHPNYFIRFFKMQLGLPPMAYISNVRLDKARRLLKDTSLSIHKIAADTGIPDYSYFARQFKRRTGYTPGEYRRLMQTGPADENNPHQ